MNNEMKTEDNEIKDLDKIFVGNKCGYRVGSDKYASTIIEYKISGKNHIIYLNDGTLFKYNKKDNEWYEYELIKNNKRKTNKRRLLDFSIIETYLDPDF